ncbi:hypothetical protein HEK616_74850 (plasmid) [Streptomyces nigrescens]|uniref:HTH marR-type domain-containing protein n=2 Tax=Streptomyces TaxID=1883 RepID=A0ABM8A5N7_STRNI|nr:MarR family winged helix-turn-helix transcriptional regulator [Streptomyces nigrescens]MEE4419271.1 MarR family winged helix-turn-helix transcriptional regulator [Streptomyces sp. DSM 41528]BDM73998.1 hypothetical protein HEK616_74850 [Streptomyces nigrescens]
MIERRKNPSDRRLHALPLTEQGERLPAELGKAGAAHERHVREALSPEEHRQLSALLRRMAEQHGLSPGVHPGYRSIRPDRSAHGSGKE